MRQRIRTIQIVAMLLAIAWGATIWWVNGLPAEDLPPLGWSSHIPHFDKIVHFGMYSTLAGLAWLATALGLPPGSRRWVVCSIIMVVVPAALGALDEWRQLAVPGRAASIYDWYANAAGATTAVVILTIGHVWWMRSFTAREMEAASAEKCSTEAAPREL